MIRKRSVLTKLTELSPSLLRELAVCPETHCRMVIVRSLINVMGLLSLTCGLFTATFMFCEQISALVDPYNLDRHVFYMSLDIFWHLCTSLLILLDTYWSNRNRNLLQPMHSSNQLSYMIIYLPFSVFSTAVIAMDALTQLWVYSCAASRLEVVWYASNICIRLLTVVFVSSTRHSCDTGESLPQTLVRYAALVHSITDIVNLGLFDISLGQVRMLKSAIFNTSSIPDAAPDGLLGLLSQQYIKYGTHVLIVGNIMGFLLLMGPLRLQWILVQQRLLSVKLPTKVSPINQQSSEADSFWTWEKVVHWLSSFIITGSLLVGIVLIRYDRTQFLVTMSVSCVNYFVAILVTIFYLLKLQHHTLPRRSIFAERRSYMWLSTDSVIISIGLLSYMVSAIADLQMVVECHIGVTNCTDRFSAYLYPVRASFELLQGISQGMLLLIFTEIDKTLWTILPDNSTIGKLLSPLHFLILFNIVAGICNIINIDFLSLRPNNDIILNQLFRETDYMLTVACCIIFRLHSVYLIAKFIVVK